MTIQRFLLTAILTGSALLPSLALASTHDGSSDASRRAATAATRRSQQRSNRRSGARAGRSTGRFGAQPGHAADSSSSAHAAPAHAATPAQGGAHATAHAAAHAPVRPHELSRREQRALRLVARAMANPQAFRDTLEQTKQQFLASPEHSPARARIAKKLSELETATTEVSITLAQYAPTQSQDPHEAAQEREALRDAASDMHAAVQALRSELRINTSATRELPF